MKVALGWLSEWIDLPASRAELEDRLTVAGLEIEDVLESGPDLSAVLIGHVLAREAHPNADRLSLCRVDLGRDEPVDIVCGASNVDAGQKVAVAEPGTTLPDGTRLKKAKIRGVASHGMICSERELGLGEGHEGILVLAAEAPVGAPLSEVLSAGDTILDLEITPNRGDWASLLGIAREVRAQFGGELRLPELEVPEHGAPAEDAIAIHIEDREGCHRYLGRVVRGVSLEPSPDWLRERVESAGVRSINVVVDVTNLVLLEFGQPLHAFDLSTLRGAEVIVRRARADEKLATLDGQMRELAPEDLVIADAERAIAVAGVMGGAETEVRAETRDVLLECAHFAPSSVRKTARRLGLSTDASYRFERGVDYAGLERAVDRAARLLAELAGGQVAPGRAEAVGAPFEHTDEVLLDVSHPERLLGTPLSPSDIESLLARVDIHVSAAADGQLRCAIPSYRNDVAIGEDLIEEIARVYGYDRIPETMPQVELRPVEVPPLLALAMRIRRALAGEGLIELRTPPWGPPSDHDDLGLGAEDPRRQTLTLLNPLLHGSSELRTSLLPALLRSVRGNLAHQVESVRVFEVAARFQPRGKGELPAEPMGLCVAVTQRERGGLWRDDAPVFFQAKGVVERLSPALGHPLEFRAGSDEPYLHPGAAAQIFAAGQRVGALGELHPEVAARFDIALPCAVFELELDVLAGLRREVEEYREVSSQPAVRRDVAVLLDRDCPAGDVLEQIRKTAGPQLVSVELFDQYEGKGIPEGKKSLAFRFVLQRADRTLKEAEISKLTERVRGMLVHRFGGELR